MAYWTAYMTDLVNYAQIGFGTNTDFLDAIQNNSADFAEIAQEFVMCISKIQIRTFFETVMMGNSLVMGNQLVSYSPSLFIPLRSLHSL